ncbi:hypothetical protein B0H13DRAFT_1857263 [Mycena leptocephala]|nr:hypothetical protein B0H13DRAFT_1857263 [Mycena leptocephala]
MPSITPERIQCAILSRADRASFLPPKLPKINDPNWTTSVAKPAMRKAYKRLGEITLRSLATALIYALLPETGERHDVGLILMLLETLLSPRTFARILLATGDYEDAPPCPFFGMSSPLVAGAFFAFVGAFMAFSEDKGLIRFSPWFDATFRPLAQAGVKGLNCKAKFTAPIYPTTRAQVDHSAESKRLKKKQRIAGRVVFGDTTNTSSATPTSTLAAKTGLSSSSAKARKEVTDFKFLRIPKEKYQVAQASARSLQTTEVATAGVAEDSIPPGILIVLLIYNDSTGPKYRRI